MMADLAVDIDTGKKPPIEVPKVKKDDFNDLLDNKPASKAQDDEEDFYAKMMADLASEETVEVPKIAVPNAKKQEDFITALESTR